MIVTVTPNPAYDATYELDAVRLGEVQRVATSRLRPGGKGVNVAGVLAQLGDEVLGAIDLDCYRDLGARVVVHACPPERPTGER